MGDSGLESALSSSAPSQGQSAPATSSGTGTILNTPTPANIPMQGATPQNQGIDPDANAQVLQQLLGWQPLGAK